MTNTEYELSSHPPRDDQGHPVHPERGHRICGAVKSDRTTPTEHGRERDDYEYCLQPAGWGEDRSVGPCRNHPVTGEQWGSSNPNHKHGAFSKHWGSDLTESESDAMDALVDALGDEEQGPGVVRELVAEALLKYKRSGDTRFLREARQLMAEFNIVPNADRIEVGGIEGAFMQDLRSAHDEQ